MGSLAPGGAGRWNHYLAGSPYLVALFMRACCHYFLLLDEHWTRQGHVNTTTHRLSSNSHWFIKYLGVGGLWQLVFVIELVKVVSCVIAFPLHYWNGATDMQLCCLWTFFGGEDFLVHLQNMVIICLWIQGVCSVWKCPKEEWRMIGWFTELSTSAGGAV